jgi:hypothetical protein
MRGCESVSHKGNSWRIYKLVKRIFEHKKEKVMEEWGKITN